MGIRTLGRSALLAALLTVTGYTTPVWAQSSRSQTFSLSTAQLCGVLSMENMGTGTWQVSAISGATLTWTISSLNTTSAYAGVDAAAPDAPATAVNTTTAAGVWSAPVAGYRFMRACIDAGTATVTLTAVGTGGGGGGGGGGAASTITSIEDGFGENVGDDANDAIRVNVVAGAGSGGTAAVDESAFTLATTNVTPIGCIEATDNQAAGAVGAVKCGADRELDVDVTNAFLLEATATTIFGPDAIFGTAGTADTDVLSVQGIASGTALNVLDTNSANALTALQLIDNAAYATTLGNNIALTQDVLFTAAVLYCADNAGTPTELDLCPSGDAGAGAAGSNTSRTITATDSPDVTALQLLDNAVSGSGFNITQMNGVNVSMGVGASGTGTQRVASLVHDGTLFATVRDLANDSLNVALTDSTGAHVVPVTSYTHDGALTPASTTGPMFFGRTSATRPTVTTANDDAGLVWTDRAGAVATFGYGVDPCASSGVAKSYAVIDVTADAIVVALTSTQTIYVCGFVATVGGTAPTFRFQTGTGTACATSTTQLSGVFLPLVSTPVPYGGGGQTIFTGDVSEDLCIDVGGTTPSVQGTLTYVKQVPI